MKKAWRYGTEHAQALTKKGITANNLPLNTKNLSKRAKNLRRKTHETIAKLDEALGKNLALNAPVSFLMELCNELTAFSVTNEDDLAVANEALITLFEPYFLCTAHISEALLEKLGVEATTLVYPAIDTSALVKDSITMVVQVNGKLRGELQVAPNTGAELLKTQAKALASVNTLMGRPLSKKSLCPIS